MPGGDTDKMTTKKKRQSHSETRKDEHMKLLAQLEHLELVDSCCDICHCDCYSTHGSSLADTNAATANVTGSVTLRELNAELAVLETLERQEKQHSTKRRKSKSGAAGASSTKSKGRRSRASRRGTPNEKSQKPNLKEEDKETPTKTKSLPQRRASVESGCSRRAKSAGSQRSRSQEQAAPKDSTPKQNTQRASHYTRDCEILQDLLTSLDEATTPQLSICGKAKSKSQQMLHSKTKPANTNMSTNLAPLAKQVQLCSSMANLCLAPTVREAFQRVPSHDKKILNRMAVKRSQQAAAKETAWLARKYWENERLERELLKCEQLEEYKRAVHDKQFQDYLETKARLNALAQRDLDELQRLRATLHDKEERARQRLVALRTERDMQLCQRRCDELRRNEAVTVQQEEQHLDDTLRKRDICQRLTERLRRADELRTQLMGSYLKRLQYDNYMEQLQHEEHWQERQQLEQYKREQLLAEIQRKRQQSQRFVEGRQRRNEAQTRTAKISASLRELVRQSVTPEGGSALGGAAGVGGATPATAAAFYVQNQTNLSRLLLERPPSKLAAVDGVDGATGTWSKLYK